MANVNLQKYFDHVDKLHSHPFFRETGLKEDLAAGEVFPAIRKNELHFYHGGARLCVFNGGHMRTNNRYLGIPNRGNSSRDVRIEADWFNPTKYAALKNAFRDHRSSDSELSVVSTLFREFSIGASPLPADRACLLDIECRFPGTSKKQDMIDCLFLTARRVLIFVEVKRGANKGARGSGEKDPAVVCQIERYQSQLATECVRETIKDTYIAVTKTLGLILDQSLPVPRSVFENVPL